MNSLTKIVFVIITMMTFIEIFYGQGLTKVNKNYTEEGKDEESVAPDIEDMLEDLVVETEDTSTSSEHGSESEDSEDAEYIFDGNEDDQDGEYNIDKEDNDGVDDNLDDAAENENTDNEVDDEVEDEVEDKESKTSVGDSENDEQNVDDGDGDGHVEAAAQETNTNNSTKVSSDQKLIKPGEHVNIPAPETRIGPNGETGYIHDPTFILKNPPPFRIPENEAKWVCKPPGEGVELPEGAHNLKNIRQHMETSQESQDVKLFCSIYTYSGSVHYTDVVSETWGKKCDGMLFASDKSNSTTGHMQLPSASRHGYRYSSMIQRMRTMFAYLYDNFLDDYDFFHFSGDDTYLLVENLKELLASDKVKEWEVVPDQYFIGGFWLNWRGVKFPKGQFYLGGGSGYTLSRKALKAHVEGPLQTCNVTTDNAMEDIFFTKCIFQQLTTKFFDTRDEFGAHRYHQNNITVHSTWPDTDKNYGLWTRAVLPQSLKYVEEEFGFPYVVKEKYISNSSVAFHRHSDPWQLRRMEMLLYKDLENECS